MNEENLETPEIEPESEGPEKGSEIKPKAPPVAVAFIALLLMFLLYQGIGTIITIAILGIDVSKSDPALFRLLTIAGQMLFILLPTLVIARYAYTDVTSIIRFRLPKPKELGLFLLGFILITPIIQNITYIQTWIIDNLAKNYGAVKQAKDFFDSMDKMVGESYTFIFSVKSVIDVFIIVIAIAVTPAICEEFFFRGLIQKSFELKWKPATSIIVSSLVFALYHFSPYGLIPLFLLSLFLGYAAYKTNSILVPAGIHFANNFFMIILYYMVGDEAVNAKPDSSVSIGSYFLFLFINILFFLVWLYFVRKFYRKPETS
jgi:membrane protease YdiL (CAAX protease family)